MLQITEKSTYVSKKGNDTFVYEVSGSKAELAAFKKAKGEYYVEDNGTPLFFTIDYVGPRGTLIITSKGNVIADKSAFKKAASLANQFEGPLGQAIAQQAATQLLGNASPTTSAAPAVNVAADEPEKL
jgi:hypothetical protein